MSGLTKIKVILLPGLNGTEGLLKKFISYCPEQFEPIPFSYPSDKILNYKELTDRLIDKLKRFQMSLF